MSGLPLYGILLLSLEVHGQHHILLKYKGAMQNYLMTGHENTLQDCDVLSTNGYSHTGEPQITMSLEKLETLSLKSVFSSSTCLLINYEISSEADLLTLLEFGKKAVNNIRLALAIKMVAGISLEKAKNTSNLAYMIATESKEGLEQFLCPVTAESKPRLENEMCKPSYLDYKNKALRVGLMGMPPDFGFTSNGTIDGVNVRLIKMMAQRLHFMPDIHIAKSFTAAVEQVCKLHVSKYIYQIFNMQPYF